MTDILAGQFTIDSSLDLAADAYTAPVVGSADYLAADDADTITLSAGLIDPATGTPYTIGHLEGGIDEYSLHITPDRIDGSIRGRDNMEEMLDRRYQMRFLRAQPTPGEKTAMDGKTFAGLPDPIRYTVGTFRASDIAAAVVASCGLTLSWECRDYTLRENFDAAGRPIDILRALVEPWSQVEALRVDVFVQGETVFCRPRSLTPAPDYTYAVTDARIKDVTLRRKRAEIYGRVSLSGEFNLRVRGLGSIVPIEVDETTEDVSGVGTYGQPLTRVIRTTTYLVPPRIPIRSHEWTYSYDVPTASMQLSKDETRTNEWEPILTTDAGVVNSPRQLTQTVVTSGIDPKDTNKRWRVLSREITYYAYGGMGILATDMFGNNLTGFQSMTTTRKWEANIRLNIMEEKERIVRTWKESGNLQTEEVTSTYRASSSTGAFYLADCRSSTSAGVPPGGPRPDRTVMIGGTGTDPREQVSLESWISTDPYAKDVSYSNRNLSQDDLNFIALQFAAASGVWQHEMLLTYVSMPWLRKGNVLQLTGLLAEDGTTPIPLGPALVAEQHLTYDESSQSPSMLSTLRAVWWAA